MRAHISQVFFCFGNSVFSECVCSIIRKKINELPIRLRHNESKTCYTAYSIYYERVFEQYYKNKHDVVRDFRWSENFSTLRSTYNSFTAIRKPYQKIPLIMMTCVGGNHHVAVCEYLWIRYLFYRNFFSFSQTCNLCRVWISLYKNENLIIINNTS